EAVEGEPVPVTRGEPAEPDPERADEERPGDDCGKGEDARREPAVTTLEDVRDRMEHAEHEQRPPGERAVAVRAREITERAERGSEHGEAACVDQERR